MSSNEIDLIIDEKARSYAKIYSSLIDNEYQRKRANAAITSLFSYIRYLKKYNNLNIQNSMTLYRTPYLCSQFEIADFYVNNFHLDVRVTTELSTVLIPKIHYDKDIIPDFYVVVKIDKDIKTAKFAGIIDTKKVKPEPCDNDYYKVDCANFITNEEFVLLVKYEKILSNTDNEHENFQNNYLGFIDNEISDNKKIEILKHLFSCPECRTEFCCFTGFEMVNSNLYHYPNILDDKTLDIIGVAGVQTDSGNIDNFDVEEFLNSEELISADKINSDENLIENTIDDIKTEDLLDIQNEENNENQEVIENENNDTQLDTIEDIFKEENNQLSEISEIETIEEISDENDIFNEEFNNQNDGIELIIDNDIEPANDNIAVIDKDFSSELTDIEGNNLNHIVNKEESSNVQRVITDYDEFGEPIYSYIASADGPDTKENDEIEIEDKKEDNNETQGDNILEENFFDIVETSDECADKKEGCEINLNNDNDNDVEKKDENIVENREELETSTEENELDILDQIFVDGALERELKEQQEVAYNNIAMPIAPKVTSTVSEQITVEETQNEAVKCNNEEEQNNETKLEQNIENKSEIQNEYNDNETIEENEQPVIEEEYIDNNQAGEEFIEKTDDDIENINYQEQETRLEETEINNNEYDYNTKEEMCEEKEITLNSDDNDSEITNLSDNTQLFEEEQEEEEYEEEEYDDEEEEEEDYEDGDEYMNDRNDSSLRKILIIVCIITAILIMGLGFFIYTKNKNSENNSIEISSETSNNNVVENQIDNVEIPINTDQEEIPANNSISKITLNSSNNIQTEQNEINDKEKGDINKAITKALSTETNYVTLKDVTWSCSSKLFNDLAFKAYLKNVDNVLRQNLKNNIMTVTEIPPRNEVIATFAIDNMRNLQKVVINESSGLNEVDKIVLQSINETFEGEKSPILIDSPLKADIYYLKVVIKL